MDKKKKWTVKDVITTVLLSAVLIVIQLVVNDKNQRFLFETSIIFSLRLA